jgi:type II secretory pathway pseudopilin PulG
MAAPAFTLVEVVLAIVIALGILVVALYFYQQATTLRAQLVEETERITAARLLMDRITGELRAVHLEPNVGEGLLGTSNSIEFVKTDVPSFAFWSGAPLGRAPLPVTDLKLIRYELESTDGTNTLGLLRTEEPLVLTRPSTNFDDVDLTNSLPSTNALPLIEQVRFLQFRYWGGTNWTDSWNTASLPQGVEVSLGSEPWTNGVDETEYPAEIYRRVIYLPGSVGLTNTVAASSLSTNLPMEQETP